LTSIGGHAYNSDKAKIFPEMHNVGTSKSLKWIFKRHVKSLIPRTEKHFCVRVQHLQIVAKGIYSWLSTSPANCIMHGPGSCTSL